MNLNEQDTCLPPNCRTIPLAQGKTVLVDAALYDELSRWKWRAKKIRHQWYAVRWVGHDQMIYMHRYILGITDPKLKCDHRDGNGLNNLRTNLRVATTSQNGYNSRRKSSNKSGFIGVSWHKRHGKWASEIMVQRRRIHLGSFDDPKIAAQARDRAAIALHGEFAKLNFDKRSSEEKRR